MLAANVLLLRLLSTKVGWLLVPSPKVGGVKQALPDNLLSPLLHTLLLLLQLLNPFQSRGRRCRWICCRCISHCDAAGEWVLSNEHASSAKTPESAGAGCPGGLAVDVMWTAASRSHLLLTLVRVLA